MTPERFAELSNCVMQIEEIVSKAGPAEKDLFTKITMLFQGLLSEVPIKIPGESVHLLSVKPQPIELTVKFTV